MRKIKTVTIVTIVWNYKFGGKNDKRYNEGIYRN